MNLTDLYPLGKRALRGWWWLIDRQLDATEYLARWVRTLEQDGWPE